MEYIVLDMEWNQALNFSEMVKDPVFLTGEIIQIGAIKLNQTLEVVDSFNERIAPQYYTELHPKVAEITKLSNRDLQKGKGFHTERLFRRELLQPKLVERTLCRAVPVDLLLMLF